MCGISAVLFTAGHAEGLRDGLEKELLQSARVMYHRGPDSEGIFVDKTRRVGLVHTRLSVIDLADGQQPLHEGSIHAVVNGEFYDYAQIRKELETMGCAFQSHVDSELVVHLYKVYGENVLQHLRGEFAFVLYDEERHSLFAARDRFGCKPLFYTMSEGRLMLASEMKALVPLGWKPEWDLHSVIQMGDYNDNRTVFKGVWKLPPGHQLTFRGGHLKIQPYWDSSYPDFNDPETHPMDKILQGVRKHLKDAIRARLRSDVPLGVYLSGGIDSGAIAGIANTLIKEADPTARLTTFTLSFPERPELDEGPIARRMADFIGAETHMIIPSEEEIVDHFEASVYHSEQPVTTFHGAGKLILSEYVRDHGFKVVLTGEGSDEVFVLNIMQGQKPAQDHGSVSEKPRAESRVGSSMLGDLVTARTWGMVSLGKEVFGQEALDIVGSMDHTLTIAEGIRPDVRAKIASGQWHPLHSAMVRALQTHFYVTKRSYTANSLQYTISKTMLANLLLNIVGDRVEMAASVEGRQPFLDHHLVDYVNKLPPYVPVNEEWPLVLNILNARSIKIKPSLAMTNGSNPLSQSPRAWSFTEKWILREAVKPFVTDEIYRRAKAQYNVPLSPQSSASLSPVQRLLREKITEQNIAKLGWANWEHIHGLLKSYLESPEYPADGGLDKRVRVLLCMVSFVILQERFKVPPVDL
ncbi:hypothetical protein AAF712_011842 [Marasmius tenuissimus]|uniref:Glutamine amidotransferase type-2 domain-containing protein n=1 Tax=Marasmius tenuissimus TaxID=585030 RepID=A0ABR2ZJB8_9AGAR